MALRSKPYVADKPLPQIKSKRPHEMVLLANTKKVNMLIGSVSIKYGGTLPLKCVLTMSESENHSRQ